MTEKPKSINCKKLNFSHSQTLKYNFLIDQSFFFNELYSIDPLMTQKCCNCKKNSCYRHRLTKKQFYVVTTKTRSEPHVGRKESCNRYYKTSVKNEGKKLFVRSGIRTHAYKSRLRPERSALDRSAILTTY